MYVARLTRPDVLLATAYLATKTQHPKEGDYKALRIIFYQKGTTSYGIVNLLRAQISPISLRRFLGIP